MIMTQKYDKICEVLIRQNHELLVIPRKTVFLSLKLHVKIFVGTLVKVGRPLPFMLSLESCTSTNEKFFSGYYKKFMILPD